MTYSPRRHGAHRENFWFFVSSCQATVFGILRVLSASVVISLLAPKNYGLFIPLPVYITYRVNSRKETENV
jgi:hypothetical protein